MNWINFIVSNPNIFLVVLLLFSVLAAIIVKNMFGFGRFGFFGYIIISVFVFYVLEVAITSWVLHHYSMSGQTLRMHILDNIKEKEQINSSVSQKSIALYNESNNYYQKKEYDKALTAINKAIEIDPQYAAAYVKRSNIYFTKGQKEEAKKDLDKAIAVKPDYAEAYRFRALQFVTEKNFGKAIEDFTKAIELDPSYENELKPIIESCK